MIFSTRQKRLVELLQGLPWNEVDHTLLYDTCDLDSEVELPVGLLAHLGILQDWKHTPQPLRPRLQGLRRRRQVGYAMQLPDAGRLFGIWQRQGLPWLLMGDAALQLISGTDYPFHAARLSVYIDNQDIPSALRQAEEAGFSVHAGPAAWQLQTKLCTIEITDKLPMASEVLKKEIAAISTHRKFRGTIIPVITAEHLLLFRMQETMLRYARTLSSAYLLEKCWEISLLFPLVDWDKVNAAALMLSDSSPTLCMAGVLSELYPLSELKALEAAILNHAEDKRRVRKRSGKMREMLEYGMHTANGHGKGNILPARLRRKMVKRGLLYLLRNSEGTG